MSAPTSGTGTDSPGVGARPGRRWAIASLLMVPGLFVLYVPLYVLGSALQAALGLSEEELLVEAGAWGVAAAALMIALTAAPQIVGIVLGLRARRLGEISLGTTGVVVNAVLGGFFVLSGAATLLLG